MEDFALKNKKKRSNGQKVVFTVVLAVIAIIILWQFGLSKTFGNKSSSQQKESQSSNADSNQLTAQDISFISGMVTTQGKFLLERENNFKVSFLKISANPTLSGQVAYVPLDVTVEGENRPRKFLAMMGRTGNNAWQVTSVKKLD